MFAPDSAPACSVLKIRLPESARAQQVLGTRLPDSAPVSVLENGCARSRVENPRCRRGLPHGASSISGWLPHGAYSKSGCPRALLRGAFSTAGCPKTLSHGAFRLFVAAIQQQKPKTVQQTTVKTTKKTKPCRLCIWTPRLHKFSSTV